MTVTVITLLPALYAPPEVYAVGQTPATLNTGVTVGLAVEGAMVPEQVPTVVHASLYAPPNDSVFGSYPA